jgi:peptide/nickel transport system permease protein
MMLLTMFALLVILFCLFRLMPGDPSASIVSASLSREVQLQLRQSWGLDKPIHIQFFNYFYRLMHLDFGVSFFKRIPVIEIIGYRFWNTVVFMLVAMVWANFLGVVLGILQVARRNRFGDTLLLIIGSVCRATPLFVTGIIMVIIFSYWLDWFPSGGMHAIGAETKTIADRFLNLDFLYHAVLPIFVASLYYFTIPFFVMRTAMLEYIGEDFVALAKAKGQSNAKVWIKHVARNAINPVVTASAMAIGFAIGGQVIVETIFRWPGMGSELVYSTLRRDYPVIQGTFFLLGVIVILMNYIADILYVYFDPRIRYA